MPANIKQIIQDLIIPEFRTLQVEIRRLDEKIDSFREEFRSEIKRLDEKIEGVKEDVRNLREEFKLAIDIHERLSALEAKIGR